MWSTTLLLFIVIPGNELDKIVIESNASPSIKDGRVGVAVEVTGDNLVLSVAQDALQWALRCLLNHLLDVVILGRFLQAARQYKISDSSVTFSHCCQYVSNKNLWKSTLLLKT